MKARASLKIRGACTFLARLRGWFARLPDEQGVWLYPCRVVHTIGMREAVNLLWIDAHGEVVREEIGVVPNQIRMCWRAASVFEVASDDGIRYRALRTHFIKSDARALVRNGMKTYDR